MTCSLLVVVGGGVVVVVGGSVVTVVVVVGAGVVVGGITDVDITSAVLVIITELVTLTDVTFSTADDVVGIEVDMVKFNDGVVSRTVVVGTASLESVGVTSELVGAIMDVDIKCIDVASDGVITTLVSNTTDE